VGIVKRGGFLMLAILGMRFCDKETSMMGNLEHGYDGIVVGQVVEHQHVGLSHTRSIIQQKVQIALVLNISN
jgi:hypothetical protein